MFFVFVLYCFVLCFFLVLFVFNKYAARAACYKRTSTGVSILNNILSCVINWCVLLCYRSFTFRF